METQQTAIHYTSNSNDNFLRKRHTTTVSFAIGILLFFLPFVEFKCGGFTLAQNSGFGIASGKEWEINKMPAEGGLFNDGGSSRANYDGKKIKSGEVNIFALVALIVAVLGFAVGLSNQKYRAMLGLCTGILAAIMLLAVMVQFKIAMNAAISDYERMSYRRGDWGVISIQFTVFYYMAVVSFATAAFFSYKHHQHELDDALRRVVDFEFQRKK